MGYLREILTDQDRVVINCTWSRIKNNSKLTNLAKLSRIQGIMVNMGPIHRELRKFLMISSNLIKSDDESMIKIGINGRFWKRTSRQFQGIKIHRIWLWFRREIEDRRGMKFLKQKIMKLKKICRDETRRSSISHGIASKIIPNLPILEN